MILACPKMELAWTLQMYVYKSHWSQPYLIAITLRAPSGGRHFILHCIQYKFSSWLWWWPALFILHLKTSFWGGPGHWPGSSSFQMLIDLQLCTQCSQCCMEGSIIFHHEIQNLFVKKYGFTKQEQSKNANTGPKYTNTQSTHKCSFSQPPRWTGKYYHHHNEF